MNQNISDKQLLEKVSRGERAAFGELIRRHSNYAFTIASRIVGSAEDAEEVVQDCFLKIVKQPGAYRGDSKFTTWFYRVVHNTALSRIRKKQIIKESLNNHIQSFRTSQDTTLEVSDQKAIISRALQGLKPEERTLITLFYLRELTQEEIAAILDIDKGTIKVRLFRARKKLGNIIKREISGLRDILI